MGGTAELVRDVAEALRGGVGEVEGLAVEAVLVPDRIQRTRDEVDGDDVDLSTLQPDERHPRWDRIAHALDQLERVVGSVDAVGLAGLRRADDEAGAIDPVTQVGLAHQALRLVLRAVVRMVKGLPFREHRLGELALRLASGNSDRADVVQAGADLLGELDHVACAADVGALVILGGSFKVVDGRQVVDVGALELGSVPGRDPQQGQGDVPAQRSQAVARAERIDQGFQPLARRGPHEDVRCAAAFGQLAEEVAADESRASSDQPDHL